MLVGFSGAVAGHPLHGSEIGDGIAHPFARGAQFGHAGAGPQDLARHRGQQLARCGPAQTAQRLRRPPCTPTPGTSTGPVKALRSGACGAVAPTTTPMDRARVLPPRWPPPPGPRPTGPRCGRRRRHSAPPHLRDWRWPPARTPLGRGRPRPLAAAAANRSPNRARPSRRRRPAASRPPRPSHTPTWSPQCRRAWRRPTPARLRPAVPRWCAPAPRIRQPRMTQKTPPAV